MKSLINVLAVLALVFAVVALSPTGAHAQTATPQISQPPVPPNTAPKASPAQPYVWRKINDHVYEVAEIHQPYPKNEVTNPPHTQTMGLVIGTKKAALIDTGLGLADLRKFVSQFTDLPIIVLNTHGDVDHVGANQLFDMSYISKEAEKRMLSANREGRLNGYKQFLEGNAEMIAFAEQSMIPDKPFKYDFIKDGDKIDLGGIELEVVAFPGHSVGSVAFIDRKDNIAFLGDSLLFRVLLGNRQSVADYQKALNNFAEKAKGIQTLLNGHQWEPFHQKDIDEEKALVTAILERKLTPTPTQILGGTRMVYVLGSKRIGLSDDK